MYRRIATALAAALLASCTATGGLPAKLDIEVDGKLDMNSDGANTLAWVDGEVTAGLYWLGTTTPVYPGVGVLDFSGRGWIVRVRDLDHLDIYAEDEPIPLEFRPYLAPVVAPVDIDSLGILWTEAIPDE